MNWRHFVLVGLSLCSTSAFAFPVQCESNDAVITFDFEHLTSISNYVFAFKESPDQKTEIAMPQAEGNGIFNVSRSSDPEEYIELPPYVAREDVKQFAASYMIRPIESDGREPYDGDIFCYKP